LRRIFTVEEPAFPVKHRLFLYVVAYAILTSMSCGTAVAQDMSLTSSAKTLSDITSAIESRKVGSLEILHMPDRTETRASVAPENLEHWVESRVEIMKIDEWGGREDLLRILRATKLAPASRMADMRSAIVFNGHDGKRIGTLYLGRYFGRYIGQFGGADGAIGKTSIKFEGDLSAWLKEMIPSR
jgi:hypothetical protein